MRYFGVSLLLLSTCFMGACQTIDIANFTNSKPKKVQRAHGKPYEMLGTSVWDIPDPSSERTYQIYISLPSSYIKSIDRKYPVLYVTDASYSFPVIDQIRRRVGGIEDFILVGLSYNKNEDGGLSRRRDYTPTPNPPIDAPPKAIYGKSDHYINYIKTQIIPFVDARFRIDKTKRIYAGHSYGGLLGAKILLTEPSLFTDYILGSPSLWFDNRFTFKREEEYSKSNKDLNANVFVFIGEYERIGMGSPKDPNRYNMVDDTNDFDRILRQRNYPSLRIKTEVLNDEDHSTIAPRGFTHALKYVLPNKNN